MKQFISEVFKLDVIEKPINYPKNTPLYIKELYDIKLLIILDEKFLILKAKNDSFNMYLFKKHIQIIEDLFKIQCVIYLDYLTSYQRKILINGHYSFVYRNKQMFIPMLGLLLQEQFSEVKKKNTFLSYNAQFVFLYLYYYFKNNNTKIRYIDIAKNLNISKPNCTRTLQELEEFELVRTISKGREKEVILNDDDEQALTKALDLMKSPIRKKIYVENIRGIKCLKSGMLALSEKTTLKTNKNDNTFAIGKKEYAKIKESLKEVDALNEDAICLEIWHYDPFKLSNNEYIDDISLLFSIGNHSDARIQNSLEEIKERNNLIIDD